MRALEKAVMLGKIERKKRMASSKMDRLSNGVATENLKDQLGTDHHGENLSVWPLGNNNYLFAHDKSIKIIRMYQCIF